MTIMENVREYNEEFEVKLSPENGRLCIIAINEAGFKSTRVDLLDLLDWLHSNLPELLIVKSL